jgi:hypothetical protein
MITVAIEHSNDNITTEHSKKKNLGSCRTDSAAMPMNSKGNLVRISGKDSKKKSESRCCVYQSQ